MNWFDSTIKYRVSEGLVASQEWEKIVTNFEGLRLESYQDSVGVWTIGYGHTLGVKKGQKITKERAKELLYKDVERFEKTVNRRVKVPLTQYQFDALVSFSFNVGGRAFTNSTLLKVLNIGYYEGVPKELKKWVYAGDERLEGLVKRRKAEAAMFQGQDWSNIFK